MNNETPTWPSSRWNALARIVELWIGLLRDPAVPTAHLWLTAGFVVAAVFAMTVPPALGWLIYVLVS